MAPLVRFPDPHSGTAGIVALVPLCDNVVPIDQRPERALTLRHLAGEHLSLQRSRLSSRQWRDLHVPLPAAVSRCGWSTKIDKEMDIEGATRSDRPLVHHRDAKRYGLILPGAVSRKRGNDQIGRLLVNLDRLDSDA